LRGVAVLLVMSFHFFQCFDCRDSTIGRILHGISSLGQTGVDLFFVLSGFLITGILLDSRGTSNYFKTFYARRALRIFPLYYAVLSFVLLYLLWTGQPRFGQVWLWTYTSNIQMTFWPEAADYGPVALPHFWSLCVEEHFYFVWPVVVFFLSRQRLLAVCAGCFLGAFLCRFLLVKMGFDPFYFTLTRIDTLALGALLAALPTGTLGTKVSRRFVFLALVGFILVGTPLYFFVGRTESYWLGLLKFSFIALFYGCILVLVLFSRPGGIMHGLFTTRTLRALGKYSYAMYVFHPIIYTFAVSLVLAVVGDSLSPYSWGPTVRLVIGYSMAILLTFVVSFISWHAYEKHFLKLKRRFVYG